MSLQPGVLRRSRHGGYADLAFFTSKEHADRIAAAESTSEPFRALLQLLVAPDPRRPASGVASFEPLRAYE